MNKDLDHTVARKAGVEAADALADIWVTSGMSPGERLHVIDDVRGRLGIPTEHRKRKYARELMNVAMNAFDLRMEARKRSHDRITAPTKEGR